MVSALHLSSSFICSQYKDTKPLLVGWFFSKKLLHNITRATRVMEEEVAEQIGEDSGLVGAKACF